MLEERISQLEQELRRTFEEAQREADAMFAQYQLSQLLASGGRPAELARAVVTELVRLCGAASGALWLCDPGGRLLHPMAASVDAPLTCGQGGALSPEELGERACVADAVVVPLGDDASPDGLIALWPATGLSLDTDGLRVVQLSRHELALAFRGAQLRETLDRERQELTAIVDGATDAILQVDEDCRIVRINPAACHLLGVGPEAIGRACGEVLHCAAAGAHGEEACPLAEVIRSGRPIAYREAAVLDASGAVICVAGGYSRAASEPGGGLRGTAILRDISAARALEQLREGFVATVSHELRTPLALIRGYTDTLLHLPLEASEQRYYLERIDQATERLSSLVKDILDIAHLDADPLILQRAPVSLGPLLARLRGDLAATGQAQRLVFSLPDDLPQIQVDASRITQVLGNLVGNALKYARTGTSISIDAAPSEGWLTVTVEDEGSGIPESDRALVLEPFHRGRNARESSIQGTGLGLYICRRLVEAHGGKLWLGDRLDGQAGTRVSFTLPLAGGTCS